MYTADRGPFLYTLKRFQLSGNILCQRVFSLALQQSHAQIQTMQQIIHNPLSIPSTQRQARP